MLSTSAPSSERLTIMARKALPLGCGALAALVVLWLVPARAAEAPLAHARLSGELLGEMVQSLLPATVETARGDAAGEERPLRLFAVKYCGPGEKGTGRLRALAGRGRPEVSASVPCAGELEKWAEGASPALAEDTWLVDLEARWKSWELKLVAVRALVTAQGGRHRPAPELEKRSEWATVSTANLRIDAGEQPIVLHVVPAFRDKMVELAIVLADKAPTRPPRAGAPRAGLAEPANCAAELPEAFANQILRLLTTPQPVSIPLQGEQVDIDHVTLAGQGTGARARLTLAGTAEPRSLRENAQWTLVAAGEPLRVSSARMVAQSEDCAGLGTMARMACQVRNGARAAAAEAFGRGLTQRYQGQTVHELVSPVRLDFTVAGQALRLSGDLLRMSFTAGSLSASARLGVR
jgi:hypothetical protein